MKYSFEIIKAYPKRRFAVYEKKKSLFDRIKKIFGIKKKPKKKKRGKKK